MTPAASARLCDPHADLHGGRRVAERTEDALRRAVARAMGAAAPPRLRDAVAYAVFPGGGRLRPRLCLAVAEACGDGGREAADAGAAAVELMHCASLVHDDLPCFDDAEIRRGRPTVHAAYGEATAVLVGDALIVAAFETLARVGCPSALLMLASATGGTRGIIAGQAWEGESSAPLPEYHRAKTAALFEAAAALGALSSGVDPESWRAVGEAVGRAYQAADDLRDTLAEAKAIGKPTGRDAALGRPNIVLALGADVTRRRIREHLAEARGLVPAGTGPAAHAWLDDFARAVGVE